MGDNYLKQNRMISLMVCCDEEAEYLDDFFGCLLAQTYDNFEVIFIDNCSNDDSYEKALKYRGELFKRNIYLYVDKIKRKHTIAKVYDMCQQEAEGEYRMNVTPQCFFRESALSEIASAFESSMCSAVIVNYNRSIFENAEGLTAGKDIARLILCGADIPYGFCAYRIASTYRTNSFYRSYTYFKDTQRAFFAACISDIFVLENVYEQNVISSEYSLESFFERYMFINYAWDKANLFGIDGAEEWMRAGIARLSRMAEEKSGRLKKKFPEEALKYEYLSKVFAG